MTVTDEMVNLACEVYAEVYHDNDKDMGDAMRVALMAVSGVAQGAPSVNETSRDWDICRAVDLYRALRNEGDGRTLSDFLAEIGINLAAQRAAALTLLSPSTLPMENDPDVLQVARAIAERGIGRYWDDFPETDAFDTDQGDLIEYARAAVEIFRRTAPQPANAVQCTPWHQEPSDDEKIDHAEDVLSAVTSTECPVNNPKWSLHAPCPVCGALGPWFENGECVAPSSTERHSSPLKEATAAQHFDLPKGERARFVRNGVLETCQCRDCSALSSTVRGDT